jgi:protein-disulfide isomerase-like protein with CxxC motif
VDRIVAWHFTDPGCPWAYSSRPAIARLRWRFGDQIDWRLVLIGLSEDASRYEERGFTPGRLALSNRKFQSRFGMPFGTALKSRMSGTSPACRVIVAAREVDPELGYAALRAIQISNFTTDRLLDEPADLVAALAGIDGLDAEAIVGSIDDADVRAAYEDDRARTRRAQDTPTHVQGRHAESDGPVRYTAPSVIFEHPNGSSLEVGGFQSFESYDTALANLDGSLTRRQPPEDAATVVLELPIGLTTAEIASIMRPSDLDDADLPATVRELIAAADAGTIGFEPHGSDALWLPPTAVAGGDADLVAQAAA